jgi:hypothetical protein
MISSEESMATDLASLPLPRLQNAHVVIPPAATGPGNWAGAPSALRSGDAIYLAYRMRQPVGEGRGGANIVARSEDGIHFTTIWSVGKESFGAESLERPRLTHGPDGVWRLYVSCATPGTKHWRVDLLEADSPDGFDAATARTVFAGDATVAMKDPVIHRYAGRWHAWVCCHPLDDLAATDRMWTSLATSDDGATWEWHGRVLEPQPGRWDSRGTRISEVLLGGDSPVALYDGRATAEENWEERTGIAVTGDGGRFHPLGDGVAVQSPHGGHGLRYISVSEAPDGATLVYYEAACPDGSHDLRVEMLPAGGPV